MSRFNSPARQWTAAVALSIGLALLAAEALLRLGVVPMPVIYESYWFSDQPAHFRDQHDSFGYRPLSSNREAVVLADLHNAVLEHEVIFRTNNAGLVQQRDIRSGERYTVVLGDSFTQGVGARPWFYALEAEFPTLSIANLGIAGTGVIHWAHAVDWFAKAAAPVRNVIVLFITDDFLRPYWQARVTEDTISFCTGDDCQLITTTYRPGTPEELMQARRLLNASSSVIRWCQEQLKSVVSRLRVGEFFINVRRWYLTSKSTLWLDENKRHFADLARRREILFAVHLPQKEEAMAEQWSPQSRMIRQFVEGTGVRTIDGLARCGLTRDGFHPRDPHPNATGYSLIRRCVADLIKEELSRNPPERSYVQLTD